MRRRRLLVALAAGAVVAAAGAALVAERSAADVLACDPPTADATSLDAVVAPGCPAIVVGSMSLDLLSFGDQNENLATTPIFRFSWGLSNTLSQALAVPPAGGASGGPSLRAVTVTRMMDKATPVLMRSCATARPLSNAQIKLFRSPGDPRPYVTIVLTNVYCSGIDLTSPSGSDNLPLETLALSVGKIEVRHTTQEGQVTRAGYDARTNTGF